MTSNGSAGSAQHSAHDLAHDAAHGARPGVQGIEDVVLPGSAAPDDWAERIFAGRPAGGPDPRLSPRPVPDPRSRPKPCDPGLARAMRAMRR